MFLQESAEFNYEHTGSDTSEAAMRARGLKPLSATELEARIANKVVKGTYRKPFKFVSKIMAGGTMEGYNNVGTEDKGHWQIDPESATLSLKWQGHWDNTTTRAYDVDGEILFFDFDTGNWRNSFRFFTDL